MLLIPIPRWTFTHESRGMVVRNVRCERCAHDYGYRITRMAKGSATSWLFLDNDGARATAWEEAEAGLARALEEGEEAVPCPECGWYQQRMIPLARRKYGRAAKVAGVVLLAAGVATFVALVVSSGEWRNPGQWGLIEAVAGGLAFAGTCFLLARYAMAAGHDPNQGSVEERRRLGRSLAVGGARSGAPVRARR